MLKQKRHKTQLKKLSMNSMTPVRSSNSKLIRTNLTSLEKIWKNMVLKSNFQIHLLRKLPSKYQVPKWLHQRLTLTGTADTSFKLIAKSQFLTRRLQHRESFAENKLLVSASTRHTRSTGFWTSGHSFSSSQPFSCASLKKTSATDSVLVAALTFSVWATSKVSSESHTELIAFAQIYR